MPQAMWSGVISFGLVNVPVKLFSGLQDKEIHFHLMSKGGTDRAGAATPRRGASGRIAPKPIWKILEFSRHAQCICGTILL
jgi:hypothetical protein